MQSAGAQRPPASSWSGGRQLDGTILARGNWNRPGFLSVFDTAWLVKRFIEEPADKVYEVIREREKLYSLLRQTTDSRLKGHYKKWTINPATRYPTTSFQFNQVDKGIKFNI